MDIIEWIMNLMDILFWSQPRILSNLEYLEGEQWFNLQYDRKILHDHRFRAFIKHYNLKKVFQNEDQKENFKRKLKEWVEHNYKK